MKQAHFLTFIRVLYNSNEDGLVKKQSRSKYRDWTGPYVK